MKRMMTLIAAALMALSIAVPASAAKDDAPGQDKVSICHFPGHEADDGVHSDWYVTGQGNHCRDVGGKVITISRKAAENGHGASAHSH